MRGLQQAVKRLSLFTWALLGIMLLGFVLRVWGLSFGLPNDSRPDELPNSSVALYNLLRPFLQGDWRMNPGLFNYPSVYYYAEFLLYWAYYALGSLLGWLGLFFVPPQDFLQAYQIDPTPFILIIRALGVLCGTACMPAMVWLMAELGQSLSQNLDFSKSAQKCLQILGTLLMATNYLAIRNSHFGTVDMPLLLGVILSLAALLQLGNTRSARVENIACVLIGLTMGIKYPAVLLLAPLMALTLYNHRALAVLQKLWAVLRVSLKTLGIFLLSSPWLLLNFSKFRQDFAYEQFHYLHSGMPWVPIGWLFYPQVALFYGIGGVVLLASLGGIFWTGCKPRWPHAVLLGFGLLVFCSLGANQRVMTRYALPLIPVVLAYASLGLLLFGQALCRLMPGWPKHVVVLVLLSVVLWQPLSQSLVFNALLSQTDTRQLARAWLLQHVRPGSIVATGNRYGTLQLPPSYGQLMSDPLLAGYLFSGQSSEKQLGFQVIGPRVAWVSAYSDTNWLREKNVQAVMLTVWPVPLFSSQPEELAALQQVDSGYRLAARFDPYKAKVDPFAHGPLEPEHGPILEPMDAFYVPFAHFEAFERPGPQILLFMASNKK